MLTKRLRETPPGASNLPILIGPLLRACMPILQQTNIYIQYMRQIMSYEALDSIGSAVVPLH